MRRAVNKAVLTAESASLTELKGMELFTTRAPRENRVDPIFIVDSEATASLESRISLAALTSSLFRVLLCLSRIALKISFFLGRSANSAAVTSIAFFDESMVLIRSTIIISPKVISPESI